MKNIVITGYAAHIGTVAMDSNWQEVKAYALCHPHDFIICGTVVIVDGKTVSKGSRCSNRYVYYVRKDDKVAGPIERLSSVELFIKGMTNYEVIRGYEFSFEDMESPPTID